MQLRAGACTVDAADDRPHSAILPSSHTQITALVDRGGGDPVEACTLLRGLQLPNGVAYDAGERALYVAAVNAIIRHEGVDAAALAGCDSALIKTIVVANSSVMPPQASHGNRGLAIGPKDGKLCECGFCRGLPDRLPAIAMPACPSPEPL